MQRAIFLRAIFLKEWLKTRRVFLIVLALSAAVTVYAVIVMRRLIELQGVDHLWMIVLLKDNTFIDIIKYVPLAAALAVSAAQMLPEMQQKRLKLTLHLPVSQYRVVGAMLCFGMAMLLSVYLLQWCVVMCYDLAVMPRELAWRIMLTSLPWYAAGFIAYLFVASVCIEGTWARRVVLALLGTASVMVCFLQPAPEAYNGMMAALLIFVVLLFVLPLGSVVRFKEGRQD